MKTPQLSSKQKCKQWNLALALAMSMVSICCLEEKQKQNKTKQNKTNKKQYNKASYSGIGLTPTQKIMIIGSWMKHPVECIWQFVYGFKRTRCRMD